MVKHLLISRFDGILTVQQFNLRLHVSPAHRLPLQTSAIRQQQ